MAPKIYYLGSAGVINFRGIRIAGISGIYDRRDYRLGYFETVPFDEGTLRSVYHTREFDVFRLAQVAHFPRFFSRFFFRSFFLSFYFAASFFI